MNSEVVNAILAKLADVMPLCPDMRIGQTFVTLEFLAEDMFGHDLYNVEDAELLMVIERFRQDLARREVSAVA